MNQQDDNVIHVKFNNHFYLKMADEKFENEDWEQAAEYYSRVMEHESDNIEVITNYTTALKELGRYKEAIAINFDLVAKNEHVRSAFNNISNVYFKLKDHYKWFIFAMSSAAMSKDVDIRAIFEDVHQVEYDDEEKFYTEVMLVSFQYVFQYLLTQQRFEDAKNYISHLEHPLRKQHIVQNSLVLCHIYLREYQQAKRICERLLKEDSSDVYALCHYTLVLYITNNKEKFNKYMKVMKKIRPMNDDERFKLGIILSYLKQYEASQKLLLPLYRKSKFPSPQMYNALSFNHYYLGNEIESEAMWKKLQHLAKNEVGPPPWTLEDSKEKFNQKVLPLLLHDNNHYRLYGIFLLNRLNGKEIFMTEEIWAILEEMTDYEKLYLTYLIQGLKLTKLDFIHRGLVELYKNKQLQQDMELSISWIDTAEALIASKVDYNEMERYLAAHVYLYYRHTALKMTKREIFDWLGVTKYKLDSAVKYLLSI